MKFLYHSILYLSFLAVGIFLYFYPFLGLPGNIREGLSLFFMGLGLILGIANLLSE